MEDIVYARLTPENFGPNALDRFVRRQEVRSCWRRVEGRLALQSIAYTEDLTLAERRQFAAALSSRLDRDCTAYGAFAGYGVMGYAVLPHARFGSAEQYVDLEEFYVSEPLRGRGIGRTLFRLVCDRARELGASKLYISAHSAQETIAAYRALGCVDAEEINQRLAEREPCDLQLEYPLYS